MCYEIVGILLDLFVLLKGKPDNHLNISMEEEMLGFWQENNSQNGCLSGNVEVLP